MTKNDNLMEKSVGYYASLYVRGTRLDPDKVTSALKIMPDYSHNYGDKFTLKSGKSGIRKVAIWRLGGKKEYRTANEALNSLFEKLMSKDSEVGPLKDMFKELGKNNEIFFDLFVVQDKKRISVVFEISADILNFFEVFAIDIKVSVESIGN